MRWLGAPDAGVGARKGQKAQWIHGGTCFECRRHHHLAENSRARALADGLPTRTASSVHMKKRGKEAHFFHGAFFVFFSFFFIAHTHTHSISLFSSFSALLCFFSRFSLQLIVRLSPVLLLSSFFL